MAPMSTAMAKIAYTDVEELVEAAEAKAYWGLAVNYAALEALTGVLMKEESITGERLAEILEGAGAPLRRYAAPYTEGFGWSEDGGLLWPGRPEPSPERAAAQAAELRAAGVGAVGGAAAAAAASNGGGARGSNGSGNGGGVPGWWSARTPTRSAPTSQTCWTSEASAEGRGEAAGGGGHCQQCDAVPAAAGLRPACVRVRVSWPLKALRSDSTERQRSRRWFRPRRGGRAATRVPRSHPSRRRGR